MKIFLVVAMLVSLSVMADTSKSTNNAAGGRGGKRRPPKEALEACTGKTTGTACTFTSPRGTVTGKCWSPKTDLPLACKPDHKPDQAQGGMPPDGEMPPPPGEDVNPQ